MNSALNEAREYLEGTTERPLDFQDGLIWDLVEQFKEFRTEADRQLGRHICYTSDGSRERFWQVVNDSAGGHEA